MHRRTAGASLVAHSSLLGQLGLFVFRGRPLQAHGVHWEADRKQKRQRTGSGISTAAETRAGSGADL